MDNNEDQNDNAYDIYIHDGNFILGDHTFGLPKLYKCVTDKTKNYVTISTWWNTIIRTFLDPLAKKTLHILFPTV